MHQRPHLQWIWLAPSLLVIGITAGTLLAPAPAAAVSCENDVCKPNPVIDIEVCTDSKGSNTNCTMEGGVCNDELPCPLG